MNKYQKGFSPIIIALIVLILAGVGGTSYYLINKQFPKQTACTMDVKICPDGSAVGRTGPNCEFAACPESSIQNKKIDTSEWKTFNDKSFGISFKYPKEWNDVSLKKENNDLGSFPGTVIYGNGNDDIGFFAYSKDYEDYDFPTLREKIDINWSIEDFLKNTNKSEDYTLLFKKINNKAAIYFEYIAPECSPMVSLSLIAPFNDDYPNFQISIRYIFDNDPIITNYKQSQEYKQSDGCDLTKPYKEIAKKINDGTYSNDLNEKISIAAEIANSLVFTK